VPIVLFDHSRVRVTQLRRHYRQGSAAHNQAGCVVWPRMWNETAGAIRAAAHASFNGRCWCDLP
jgi:hypothetical protein